MGFGTRVGITALPSWAFFKLTLRKDLRSLTFHMYIKPARNDTSQADGPVSGTKTLYFGIILANLARQPRASYTYHAGNCASATNTHRTYACTLPPDV
jgi:hypothetical protein